MTGSDRPHGGEIRATNGRHLTEDELNRYLDGDLAPQEAVAAESHLASCELCRSTFADLRTVTHLLSRLPQVEVPRSFRLGPEHLRGRRSVVDRFGAWLMPALPAMRAATIAIALTLGSLTVYRALDDQPQTGPATEQSARDSTLAETESANSRVAITSTSVAAQSGPADSLPVPTESAAAVAEIQAPAAKTGADAAAPADESAADDSTVADEATDAAGAAGASSASEENSVMIAMETAASPTATVTPTPLPTATPSPATTPTIAEVGASDDGDSWIGSAQWILGVLLAGLTVITLGVTVAMRRSAA